MKSKEEINMLGFTIVAYAGDARSDLMDALAFARDGYFEQARELVESANDSIVSAHREQTNFLLMNMNEFERLKNILVCNED
ncbi:lactose-specific phosphotransferase EIIA [Streptococcus pneumoniae]|nr:lactose-specific phosphotransferase EIIA [Streptococcus pneumoniae]